MEVHKVLCLLRNLHMEVHKVLRLPRNLHLDVQKVLQLPQNLDMEVHKVLRLPRNLHFKKTSENSNPNGGTIPTMPDHDPSMTRDRLAPVVPQS